MEKLLQIPILGSLRLRELDVSCVLRWWYPDPIWTRISGKGWSLPVAVGLGKHLGQFPTQKLRAGAGRVVTAADVT